jgi:hypothetical protein
LSKQKVGSRPLLSSADLPVRSRLLAGPETGGPMRQNKFVCFREHTPESGRRASSRASRAALRCRIPRISLNLLNLPRMPRPMLCHHHQPLVAIQIPERDMREEVPAQIALQSHHKR